MTGHSKQEIILEAAVKIFSKKGFSGATTSEIANEAGVAEGTIFRYYKTKKDLLLSASEKLTSFLGEVLIVDRISKIVTAHDAVHYKKMFVEIAKDRMKLIDEHWELIMVVINELQYHEELRKQFYENVILKGKTLLEGIVQNGIEMGYFRKINPAIGARMILGNLGTFILQRKMFPQLININPDIHLEQTIELMLHGLLKKEGN